MPALARPCLLALLAGWSLVVGGSRSARGEWRIVDHGSPWSGRRPVRPHTRYIVLHTTEGATAGALEKLAREGEAHYLVDLGGKVHRVVDRRRIATHAGRSLWEGRTNLDEHAIGVEVVGYHDQLPTEPQISALAELLRQLQGLYDIPDERVLTHSMVAYGAPNRWHRRRHRGRKRCAMRLADPSLRARLGLHERPQADPDVRAGRLVVGDPDLFAFLFPKRAPSPAKRSSLLDRARSSAVQVIAAGRSPWDIAKEAFDRPEVTYLFPDGTVRRGDQIRDWRRIPAGTRVELGSPAASAPAGLDGLTELREATDPRTVAGEEHDAATTIYLFPSGLVRTGAQLRASAKLRFLLDEAPAGTRILVGYQYGGYVTARRPPSVICGTRWNYPSTFYRLPDGAIRSGDEVEAARIPKSTLVFFQS